MSEQVQDWESLIAQRMRPCATMPSVTDTVKERRRIYNRRRYHRIKNLPGYKQHKREYQKQYRNSDDYRKKHNGYMKEWRKTHPLTEYQKWLQRERNRRYNERKKAAKHAA